eukprot:14915003-Alexandrium_andersonii.AAC.1
MGPPSPPVFGAPHGRRPKGALELAGGPRARACKARGHPEDSPVRSSELAKPRRSRSPNARRPLNPRTAAGRSEPARRRTLGP